MAYHSRRYLLNLTFTYISLLILISAVLPLTIAGQDFASGKLLQRFDDQHVFGLALYRDLIAVALENSIVLSRVQERNDTTVLEDTNTTLKVADDNLSALLEFKLVNETTIFYCTPRNCRQCDFRTKRCTTFQVESTEGQYYQIRAEVLPDQVFLRAIRNGGNASIFAYNQSDSNNGVVSYSKAAPDHIQIVDHKVVGSFHTDAYTYFLGSAKRNDLPSALFSTAHKSDRQRTDVRLSRICNRDGTLTLESRIDVVLSCDGIGFDAKLDLDDSLAVINNMATAMTLTSKSLYVVVQKSGEKGTTPKNVVCSYDLPGLLRSFDETWDKCQNVEDVDDVRDECEEGPGGYASMKDECFIFSWERKSRINLCAKFNKGINNLRLNNCDLHQAKSSGNRNGWIENFKPIEGRVIARLDDLPGKSFVSMCESPTDPKTLFLLSNDGVLIRISKNSDRMGKILWKDDGNKNQFVGYHNLTNRFFYSKFSEVKSIPISCNGFYGACEKIDQNDPLDCGWCAHPNGAGHSVSLFHKDTCEKDEQLLRVECPPSIAKVDISDKTMFIGGTSLRKLTNLSVDVCGLPCTIKTQDDTLITCDPNVQRKDGCEVRLRGDLPTYKDFQLRYNKFEASVDSSSTNAPESSYSKKIRYVFAVVAILILFVIVIVLWCCYKKFAHKIHRHIKKKSTHQSSPPKTYNYLPSTADMIVLDDMSNDHYINPDHLIRLRKLGEGFSAIVYLMSYRPDGKNEIQVAVKNIHSVCFDIEDAHREIRLISDCQHPNIVTFIGYFKDPKFDSLHLVTEYMPGGNLHNYLRDSSNKPTIGDCFSYILQIADGMEYLGHKHLVHRDLAARNCLLDITNKIIKITDFGLSRKCNIDYDYVSQNTSGKQVNLPIRWTAIEVLRDPLRFSDKSDVWSYGIVLWETFMRGELPYTNMNQEEIKTFLFEGRRLEQPQYAPDDLYKVMCRCWEELPGNRPKFCTLKIQINAVLEHLQNQDPAYLTPNSKSVDEEFPSGSKLVSNSECKLVDESPV